MVAPTVTKDVSDNEMPDDADDIDEAEEVS